MPLLLFDMQRPEGVQLPQLFFSSKPHSNPEHLRVHGPFLVDQRELPAQRLPPRPVPLVQPLLPAVRPHLRDLLQRFLVPDLPFRQTPPKQLLFVFMGVLLKPKFLSEHPLLKPEYLQSLPLQLCFLQWAEQDELLEL